VILLFDAIDMAVVEFPMVIVEKNTALFFFNPRKPISHSVRSSAIRRDFIDGDIYKASIGKMAPGELRTHIVIIIK
jgi:hypothetical protein